MRNYLFHGDTGTAHIFNYHNHKLNTQEQRIGQPVTWNTLQRDGFFLSSAAVFKTADVLGRDEKLKQVGLT